MTLKDMARDLGVAPSTISRVLNGCSKNFTIPDELRKRILDHVEKCGYRANPVFQSMKLRKNKQVAVLFYSRTSMSTGFTVEQMVDKATLFLRDHGYEVNYTFCRWWTRRLFFCAITDTRSTTPSAVSCRRSRIIRCLPGKSRDC